MHTYRPGDFVSHRGRIGRIVGGPSKCGTGFPLTVYSVQFNRGSPEVCAANVLEPVEMIAPEMVGGNVVPIRPDMLINATGLVC